MSRSISSSLSLQYSLGRMAVFAVGPLVMGSMRLAGYRIRGLDRARKKVAEAMEEHPGPWLICANHLTLIDSFIIAHAMFPLRSYLLRFHLVPWNMPEYMNFSRNPVTGLLCYLLKCVPVKRGGSREDVKQSLEKCAFILNQGENLMIFPEGTRSRTGRVNTEDFTYHVGRLYCKTPGCRVLCIYLRGDSQESYSSIPRLGETFTMKVSACSPATEYRGLKAQRDCASQIVKSIARMEEDYFASCGK